MTLNVSYTTDLEVKSERTQVDRAFFNRRFKAVYDELARLDTEMSSFGDTENTLVQIGLQRLNEVLGPLLTTLQEASELGFLVCRSIGDAHSLVGGEFVGWHITEGATLFTPTHFLLALDETDYTNWGVVSIDADGWHATTGELSTHVIYSSKIKSSTQWSLSASASVLPAMEQMLVESKVYAQVSQAAQISVNQDMAQLQGLIDALQTGAGVQSVNGKSGIVQLVEADIPSPVGGGATLVTDLAAKASTAYVNTQVSARQLASAKLTALNDATWSANKVLMATGATTVGTIDISDYAKTLLTAPSALGAQTTIGISPFMRTFVDDVDAATARATLGIAAAPDIPAKASFAEVAIGTDDVKFATSAGIANQYVPKLAGINSQSGNYTLVDADNGKIIRIGVGTAATCSLPASAPVGFSALIEQSGVGQVTINVTTNAVRQSYGSKFKTAGPFAIASVYCWSNSDGAHAIWTVSGNLVA